MNRRTKEIEAAILKAKQRDEYKCRKCGLENKSNHGAHLIGRNVPYKKNDPTNPKYIITLCFTHHKEYDKNTDCKQRIKKLREWGLFSESAILKELIKP